MKQKTALPSFSHDQPQNSVQKPCGRDTTPTILFVLLLLEFSMTLHSRKLVVAVVVLFCSISQLSAPSSEHGLGFLQRVRNNSEYPIDFSQDRTILDYLPDGTVLRIKSLRKEYGSNGRYYAVRKIVGAYRLQADTFDPNDPATHFVVKRFVSRNFTEYMGLYSDFAEGQFMKSDDSRAITFSMPDIMDDKAAQGHWSIVDISGQEGAKLDDKKFMDPTFAASIFNACYLKSRASGFMQSRGVAQNYPGLEKAPVNKYANPILQGNESSTKETTTTEASSNAPTNSEITAGSQQTSTAQQSGALAVQKTSPVTAPGTITSISSDRSLFAHFVDASTVVIIRQNGTIAQQKSDGSWETITQGLSGAGFKSVAPGDDGSLWGCDINNNVWEFDSQTKSWNKVALAPSTSSVAKLSMANASNIWALSGDGVLFQRIQESDNTSWKIPDQAIGSGAIKDFCVASDGTIMVLAGDNKIYRGLKTQAGYSFNHFCTPTDMVGLPAMSIAVGSKSFVAFSTPTNEVFVLVSGKPGNTKDSWKKVTLKDEKTPIKLRSFSAHKNNSLVGTVHNSGKDDDNSVVLISDISTT